MEERNLEEVIDTSGRRVNSMVVPLWDNDKERSFTHDPDSKRQEQMVDIPSSLSACGSTEDDVRNESLETAPIALGDTEASGTVALAGKSTPPLSILYIKEEPVDGMHDSVMQDTSGYEYTADSDDLNDYYLSQFKSTGQDSVKGFGAVSTAVDFSIRSDNDESISAADKTGNLQSVESEVPHLETPSHDAVKGSSPASVRQRMPEKRKSGLMEGVGSTGNGIRKKKRESYPLPPEGGAPEQPHDLRFMFLSSSGEEGDITGVRCDQRLEPGRKFGPFPGDIVDEVEGYASMDTWELCLQGRVLCYIRGKPGNWMTHVRCARSTQQQNLEALQAHGEVFFRTSKVIEAGSELMVFYSEEYAELLGFRAKLDELKVSADQTTFHCNEPGCQTELPTAKLVMRHMRLAHHAQAWDNLQPVISWEPRQQCPIGEDARMAALERKSEEILDKRQKGVWKAPASQKQEVSEKFLCQTCGLYFTSQHWLQVHKALHELSRVPSSGNQIGGTSKCKRCSKTYLSREALHRHEQEDHGRKDLSSTQNSKVLSLRYQRYVGDHNTRENTLKAPKVYNGYSEKHACQLCGKIEPTADALSRHMVKHSIWQYTCEVCNKAYLTESLLKSHKRYAHGGLSRKKFACRLCVEVFQSQQELIDHERVHSQQNSRTLATSIHSPRKPGSGGSHPQSLKCQICPMEFLSLSSRCAHELCVHLMQFVCKVCGQTFMNRSRLLDHKQVHSSTDAKVGRKPAASRSPWKIVSSTKDVKAKSKVNPPEVIVSMKKHVASLAEQKLLNTCELSTHLAQHQAKKYKCELCSKSYSTPSALQAHERLSHKFCATQRSRNKSLAVSKLQSPSVDRGTKFHPECSKTVASVQRKSLPNRESPSQPMHSINGGPNKFMCQVCRKHCHSLSVLQAHERYYHQKQMPVDRHAEEHTNTSSKALGEEESGEGWVLHQEHPRNAEQASQKSEQHPELKVSSICSSKDKTMEQKDQMKEQLNRDFGERNLTCLRQGSLVGVSESYELLKSEISVTNIRQSSEQKNKLEESKNPRNNGGTKAAGVADKKLIVGHNRIKPHACRFCTRRFRVRAQLKVHEVRSHGGTGRFKCPQCPRRMETKYKFHLHLQQHVLHQLFRCQECPRTFASETALANHQKEHSGLKPVKCGVCGRGFRTKRLLQAHVRRMHRIVQRNLQCSRCPKRFSKKWDLIKHEDRHTGIRPFVCDTCGKAFTAKHSLKNHAMCHGSKDDWFECKHCGHKFAVNYHYYKHIITCKLKNREEEKGEPSREQEARDNLATESND